MAIGVDGTYASNYAAMMLSVAPQNGLEYQGPRRDVPEGNTLIRPSSLWTPPEDTVMKTSKTLISHEIKISELFFKGG